MLPHMEHPAPPAPRPLRPLGHYVLLAGALALLAAGAELAMGRVPVSKSGRVVLWNGVVASPENSQQVTD